ncbi:carbohydrate ABC transporter permease [Ruminococcaceae bacterium OttesenSCG-928-L11]|nr:carbohydrate ABC transporter permease [Ruminococcaceae bacterium OttesenSCG-928-L11]
MATKAIKSHINNSRADRVFNFFNYIVLALVLVGVLYPLWYILIASISDPNLVTLGKVTLYPKGVTFAGYKKVLEYRDVWIGFRNSIFYTVAFTALSTALTVSSGYVLSRKDLVGRKLLTGFFMVCMFFNGGLIPTYMVVRSLGMIDTVWAVIVPNCVWVYNMLIARTFFSTTLPDEMLEATQIDGCTNLRFFFRFAIPLSPSIIAVIALFYAVAQWNSFFDALVYLKTKDLYPLQIHLRNILLMNSVDSSVVGDAASMDERQRLADMLKYVLIIVSSTPMFILYPFVQKYFVKGVMIGAVKG